MHDSRKSVEADSRVKEEILQVLSGVKSKKKGMRRKIVNRRYKNDEGEDLEAFQGYQCATARPVNSWFQPKAQIGRSLSM